MNTNKNTMDIAKAIFAEAINDEGDRNENLWFAVCDMAGAGCDAETILAVFEENGEDPESWRGRVEERVHRQVGLHRHNIETSGAGVMAERIYNATYANGKLKTRYAKYNFIVRRLKEFAEEEGIADRLHELDTETGVWVWGNRFNSHLSWKEGASAGSDFYRYLNDCHNFKALVKKAIA